MSIQEIDFGSVLKATAVFASSINGAAGGGGGGGGTGNFSNINIAVGGAITFSNDSSWDSQGIEWNTDTTGTSSINITPSYLNDETGGNASVGLGVGLSVPGGYGFQNLGVNSLYLNTGYGSIPGAVLMNDPINPGTAYVSSFRTINSSASDGQISSIQISSVNGYNMVDIISTVVALW